MIVEILSCKANDIFYLILAFVTHNKVCYDACLFNDGSLNNIFYAHKYIIKYNFQTINALILNNFKKTQKTSALNTYLRYNKLISEVNAKNITDFSTIKFIKKIINNSYFKLKNILGSLDRLKIIWLFENVRSDDILNEVSKLNNIELIQYLCYKNINIIKKFSITNNTVIPGKGNLEFYRTIIRQNINLQCFLKYLDKNGKGNIIVKIIKYQLLFNGNIYNLSCCNPQIYKLYREFVNISRIFYNIQTTQYLRYCLKYLGNDLIFFNMFDSIKGIKIYQGQKHLNNHIISLQEIIINYLKKLRY